MGGFGTDGDGRQPAMGDLASRQLPAGEWGSLSCKKAGFFTLFGRPIFTLSSDREKFPFASGVSLPVVSTSLFFVLLQWPSWMSVVS